MAPYPGSSASFLPPSSIIAARNLQESEKALPGMKRGIAIGIACSVTVLLIGLLAFCTYRRHKNMAGKLPKQLPERIEKQKSKSWFVKKFCIKKEPPPPPVEVEARMIYELDATPTCELAIPAPIAYVQATREFDRKFSCTSEDAAYKRKLEEWKTWTAALDMGISVADQTQAKQQLHVADVSPLDMASQTSRHPSIKG